MLLLLLLGLEGLTEVDTDPRQRFVSFKVITINESYVCTPSGYSTREQLAMGCFFEGLQKYMQNKHEGNENNNGIEDLLRRENPDSPEFIYYDRSFAKDQYRQGLY